MCSSHSWRECFRSTSKTCRAFRRVDFELSYCCPWHFNPTEKLCSKFAIHAVFDDWTVFRWLWPVKSNEALIGIQLKVLTSTLTFYHLPICSKKSGTVGETNLLMELYLFWGCLNLDSYGKQSLTGCFCFHTSVQVDGRQKMKKPWENMSHRAFSWVPATTYFPTMKAVSSALKSLTTEFGMGSGRTSSL